MKEGALSSDTIGRMDASSERRLKLIVLRHFDQNSSWPTVELVHRMALGEGLRLPLKDVADFFHSHSGALWHGGEARLRVSDLAELPEAHLHRDNFVNAIRLTLRKFSAAPYSERPVLTSSDVLTDLLLSERESWQLYLLFDVARPHLFTGSEIAADGKSWKYWISADVVLFEDVSTFDEYLAKVKELNPELAKRL